VPLRRGVHNDAHDAHAAHAAHVAAAAAAQQERSASHVGEKVKDGGGKKCGGGGKKHSVHSSKGGDPRGAISAAPPTLGDCAKLLVLLFKEVVSFPPYYLLHVRPGLLMAILLFTQANVEAYKLGLYLLWHVVLDAKFLLPQLRQREHDNFYAMNMQMYLLVTGYLSTFFLFTISPPAMELLLTTTVYEPKNFQNYVMSGSFAFARMKMCYDDYIALHRGTILSFLSLSLIPGAYTFFLYRFANKYGEQYYTGDAPVPTGWGGAS
jgi:hypothetical protein